ncbi:hypothetical protein LWI29_022939 [Acer saccharum]|uniref:Pleckstrin-like plant domain-containing protein n=1 Tax=Acer saccharum TaxID=4024 RepID=A0AA39TUQ7_ACESA|nr:hypothetical protein LWI29_022939 [Acer saccharum]
MTARKNQVLFQAKEEEEEEEEEEIETEVEAEAEAKVEVVVISLIFNATIAITLTILKHIAERTWSWNINTVEPRIPATVDGDGGEIMQQPLHHLVPTGPVLEIPQNKVPLVATEANEQVDTTAVSRPQRVKRRPAWMTDFEVMLKMKGRHVAGTFTKKKKNVVLEVIKDMPAWSGRHLLEGGENRRYFGLKTVMRGVVEYDIWTQGVSRLLTVAAERSSNRHRI